MTNHLTDIIREAMDNVHDMDVTLDDYAAAAAKAVREALGWQPIEKAPRGVGDYLVYQPIHKSGRGELAPRICFISQAGTIRKSTHWMPLPAAPKEAGREA